MLPVRVTSPGPVLMKPPFETTPVKLTVESVVMPRTPPPRLKVFEKVSAPV